jgi:hypothetical protein
MGAVEWFFPSAIDGAGGDEPEMPAVRGPVAELLAVVACSLKRCRGAWSILAGASEAFVGMADPGPCVLRWQPSTGEAEEKTISVEVRFCITS